MDDFAFVKFVFWGLVAFVVVAFLYARKQKRSAPAQLSSEAPDLSGLPTTYTAHNVRAHRIEHVWWKDAGGELHCQAFVVRRIYPDGNLLIGVYSDTTQGENQGDCAFSGWTYSIPRDKRITPRDLSQHEFGTATA